MKYTSKEIAEILGVSQATVSLVINGKPGVGLKKKREIIDKIRELNCDYLLKNELKNSENIGFIVDKCLGTIINEFPFFNYLFESINKQIQYYNYNLNVIYLESNMSVEEKIQVILKSECKAFIVYAVEMHAEDLEVYHNINSPCVFLDNTFEVEPVDSISINNRLGVSQAVNYLYNMGHRKIGYIKSKSKIVSFDERFEAFNKELDLKNLKLDKEHILNVGYTEEEAVKDVTEYFKNHKEFPTAFFADNDLLGGYAICAMKNLGYNVPKDFSIVGFDNRSICTFIHPKLTTIEVAREDMGCAAVERLQQRIEGKCTFCTKELIGTGLVERESVCKID